MDFEEQKLKELLLQSLKGNQLAYKTFLEELISILKKYFSKKIQNQTDVDDLIQETLISIHKALHTFDKSLPLYKWVYTIAYYKYIDYIRKNSKIKKNEIQWETFTEIPTKLEKEAILSYENANRIESVLNLLTNKEKKIFQLLKIEKFSIREAAKELNVSEGALKVAAHRVYKKIKKLINQKEL
ncbi:MAG: sigma-70 family RNA polymerase sigma factor [Leptonema sp. (in: bacteria)]